MFEKLVATLDVRALYYCFFVCVLCCTCFSLVRVRDVGSDDGQFFALLRNSSVGFGYACVPKVTPYCSNSLDRKLSRIGHRLDLVCFLCFW